MGSSKRSLLSSLAAWTFFGFLHELFHMMAAWAVTGQYEPEWMNMLGALAGRACEVPADHEIVAHAGWMGSVLVACAFSHHPALRAAAWITAAESVCTDLFGIGVIKGISGVAFCGNFGIILLNPAWTQTPGDYGSEALRLLEKMIEVTMMRGAQTGGVVSWTDKGPVRVRVVNQKRTDLSEELRKALNRKLCDSSGRINPSVRTMLGHTRFATTSKATLDGTHPHQWTPEVKRRVYSKDDIKLWTSATAPPQPTPTKVSNYITHNGDLDFFKLNGAHADLETVQKWLVLATGYPMPAPVDSAVIAGLVDVIRCQGCFGLSLRYALLLGTSKSVIDGNLKNVPTYAEFESVGMDLETTLAEFCEKQKVSLFQIQKSEPLRLELTVASCAVLKKSARLRSCTSILQQIMDDSNETANLDVENVGSYLYEVTAKTIEAFFDNDLFQTTKFFLRDAVGSFGLMFTSSLDAKRHVCIAARGQPMSVVFYPDKHLICYGSELSAVKAGLGATSPAGTHSPDGVWSSRHGITENTCRFDLDDLGGEVVLIDYSKNLPDGSSVCDLKMHQESKTSIAAKRRVTNLTPNELLLPLQDNAEDLILADLKDIPKALQSIQTNWREGGLNRCTAWNLGRSLRERLTARADGKIVDVNGGTVDVLVTGCEVSLWLAEQFASDLQKSFPKLFVKSMSSNKLLGVFGQELAVPAIGFPLSEKVPDLKDVIVIIVSHSGGTFGPWAVSNLLQSVTRHIYVVASEWDTQIGKQLRGMQSASGQFSLASHIFATNVGVRPAEPCSLSVVATHQLLTQIYEFMALVVLSDTKYRRVSGAVVTKTDLQTLERCNRDNIIALEEIVGTTVTGKPCESNVRKELQKSGDLWANHILENARAYIMSFVYVIGTVTSGYPLVTGIAVACGLDVGWAFYIARFLDALIYFFLPQINIIILRLIQGRNLRHRMVGRTAVIGDIPWVAQSADAFLSKIFARSYSIAGLNVLHGNPSDHLVHRHTHRVVRGSLLVCGRPDGRLAALTSAECAVGLSVSQASSIISMNGTCESLTIGHNPSELSLTHKDIFLPTIRPKFLCEEVLSIMDSETARKRRSLISKQISPPTLNEIPSNKRTSVCKAGRRCTPINIDGGGGALERSTSGLKGAYLGLQEKSEKMKRDMRQNSERSMSVSLHDEHIEDEEQTDSILTSSKIETIVEDPFEFEAHVLQDMIEERQKKTSVESKFRRAPKQGTGVNIDEFTELYSKTTNHKASRVVAEAVFHEADISDSGEMSLAEFKRAVSLKDEDILRDILQSMDRDERGLLNVEPSKEEFFGEELRVSSFSAVDAFAQSKSQHFAMELYESRVASMQRFVAMCVMFHRCGKRVQDFFPKYSLGLMGYKMERTHSIMRIATTASPVSGDAVRGQMNVLRLRARYENAARLISATWHNHQRRRMKHAFEQSKR